MKFVLFSDLHLDSPFQWAGPSLGRKLRLGLRETLDRICRLAVDEGADALLCAGDLYEQESFTPDTAEYLRSSFEKLTPLRVFIAPGNHDWYGPTALYREVPWSPNVRVFDESRLTARPARRAGDAVGRGPSRSRKYERLLTGLSRRWPCIESCAVSRFGARLSHRARRRQSAARAFSRGRDSRGGSPSRFCGSLPPAKR